MAKYDYENINRSAWNERASTHMSSPDYLAAKFLADPAYLSTVVSFDIPLLGPVDNLEIIHLQCHIGTDTLSLARRGAKAVVGLDFSPSSLVEAKRLCSSAQGGEKVTFIESNVYEAVHAVHERKFDLVFTGIGALCWIPDVKAWAKVVSGLLKPGGRLFIREGHPMLWAVDEKVQDHLALDYPYFETKEPMIFEDGNNHVQLQEGEARRTMKTIVWNHGLGVIVQSLLESGMRITSLVEHDTIPWEALPGKMVQKTTNEWALKHGRCRLPMTYTLQCVKT